MANDLTTLAKRLASEGPSRVTLLQGEERLLVDEALRQVLEASVDADGSAGVHTKYHLRVISIMIRTLD